MRMWQRYGRYQRHDCENHEQLDKQHAIFCAPGFCGAAAQV
jgi:hypothetical protein